MPQGLYTLEEVGHQFLNLQLHGLGGKQWRQAHQGVHFKHFLPAVGKHQRAEVKTVLLVPKRQPTIFTDVIHSLGDFKEFFQVVQGFRHVGFILAGQFQRDFHQGEREHGGPGGAIRLLQMSPGRQLGLR